MRQLYLSEKDSILKTSPLTYASVYPSKLQLQNVQHVLKVFNEKVVASLRLMKKDGTADFIQQILTWWNIVNVSSKGQDQRMRDPSRAVQDAQSTNLQSYLTLFWIWSHSDQDVNPRHEESADADDCWSDGYLHIPVLSGIPVCSAERDSE